MAGAKGVRAGRAFVELFAEDSKLRRGLRSAQKRLQGFAKFTSGLGARLLAVGGALATPFGLAIKAASDLEETMNKFDVVFGANAEEVKKWSDTFAAEVGRSKTSIASFLAESQDLLVPVGVDPAVAQEASKTLAGLAVDLASFNNKSDSDVFRDLTAALTGSSETVKKYGVVVSAAAVKAKLLEDGIDPKKATEAQKAMARLAIIVRDTSAAQGDSVRSSGSFANQLKRVQSTATDAAAEVGIALLPAIAEMLEKVSGVVKILEKWATENQSLVKTIALVVAGIVAAGVGLLVVGALASAFASILGLVSLGFGAIGTVIGVVVAVMGALVSPIGLVTAGIVALLAYFVDFGSLIEGATQAGSAAFSSFKDRALESWGAIRDAVGAGDLKTAFKIAALFLKAEWARVVSSMSGKWSEFTNFFQTVWSNAVFNAASVMTNQWAEIQSIGVKTWDVIADAFSVFTSGLRKGWNSTVGFFKSAWSKLKATVTGSEDKSEEINKATREVNQQVDRDRDKAIVEREQERKSSLARIESQRTAVQKELSSQQETADANREAALTAELAENQLAIDSAREELAASIKAAADKRAAEASAQEGEKAKQAAKVAEKSRGVTQKEEKTKSSVEGAFSVFQAVALGSGSSAEDRTAKATEETAKHAKATVRAVKDAAPTFA